MDRSTDGGLRKLDRRICEIRTGVFKASVEPANILVPVLVSYEPLGENIALYRWIHRQVIRSGLFRNWGVTPLVIASISDFERLIALGEREYPFSKSSPRSRPTNG